MERNYCMKCGTTYSNTEVFTQTGVPMCTRCGGLVRPDVVWFGEQLPVDEWEGAVSAVDSADIILSIGTSGVVYPAAELPLRGKRAGAYLVEINVEPTELSGAMDEVVMAKSAVALPELLCSLDALHETK